MQTLSHLDWVGAYRHLGIRPDIRFDPPRQGRFDVYVVKGVTPNKVVNALRRLGVDIQLTNKDADASAATNDRNTALGSYKITFRANIEADPDLANCSALDIENERVYVITLLERLLLGLAYFLGTGEHLDHESVTLCAGSRDKEGRVPGVSHVIDCHVIKIDWSCPGDKHPGLRPRVAMP